MGARRLLPLLGLTAVLGLAPVALAAGGGSWGTATAVPGVAALNLGGEAVVTSVSCASAGNCAAGGYYQDRPDLGSNYHRAFVVDEKDGVWGTAIEVPGLVALNLGVYAEVRKVSCGSAGKCAAIGFYEDGSHLAHVFVADLTNGVWGTAATVRGTRPTRFNNYDLSYFGISCTGAGACAAGFGFGWYGIGGNKKGFVVEEKGGVWGKARKLPGSALACTSPGNCVAVGGPFVADEKNGVWGKAHKVLSAIPPYGAGVISVSCSSPGNCVAGGQYHAGGGRYRAFLVSEKHGVWGRAKNVPDTAALRLGPSAGVGSVSCAGAGSCAASGYYSLTRDGAAFPFVMAQRKGVWGKAIPVPGLATDAPSRAGSVSCASGGTCVAVGSYTDFTYTGGSWYAHDHAYVLDESNGKWHAAGPVPGLAALNLGGNAGATSVSCSTAGSCSIGGIYMDGDARAQAFVTSP